MGGYRQLENHNAREPVPLDENEISAICLNLPPIQGANKAASDVATAGVRETLAELLQDIDITKDGLGIFFAKLLELYGTSLVVPGDSIGTNGASGLSAIITQLSLNTFHRAGFSETISALNKLDALIHAKVVRKDEACIVTLARRGTTFEEALTLRQKFVGSTVADFVKDYETFPFNEFGNQSYYPSRSVLDIFTKNQFDSIGKMFGRVFRIHLNTKEMAKQAVKIGDIANVLETSLYNQGTYYYVIPSPHMVGIIDILINPKTESKIGPTGKDKTKENLTDDRDLLDCTTFEKIVYPSFKHVVVKGIPGIRVWTPVKTTVIKLIETEKPFSKFLEWNKKLSLVGKQIPEGAIPSCFFLYLDRVVEVRTGLNYENLALLFPQVGINIIHHFPEKRVVIVQMPQQAYDHEKGEYIQPSSYISKLVKVEADNYKKLRQQIREKISIEYRSLSKEQQRNMTLLQTGIRRPQLVTASEYVYVVTQNATTKLKETISLYCNLLSSSLVDKRYTYSNNMHVMAEVLGIEVALASQHYELYEIVTDSGTYVNANIITMITEFIMSRGKPYGATFVGIARHPTNATAAATLERAGTVFITTGLVGELKTIKENISSTICVGLITPVGTGAVTVGRFIEVFKDDRIEKVLMINDELPTAFRLDRRYN